MNLSVAIKKLVKNILSQFMNQGNIFGLFSFFSVGFFMDLFGQFYWLTIQRSTSKLSIRRWSYNYMYSFNMLIKSFSVVSHFIAVYMKYVLAMASYVCNSNIFLANFQYLQLCKQLNTLTYSNTHIIQINHFAKDIVDHPPEVGLFPGCVW